MKKYIIVEITADINWECGKSGFLWRTNCPADFVDIQNITRESEHYSSHVDMPYDFLSKLKTPGFDTYEEADTVKEQLFENALKSDFITLGSYHLKDGWVIERVDDDCCCEWIAAVFEDEENDTIDFDYLLGYQILTIDV